jgi:hypothetical protein
MKNRSKIHRNLVNEAVKKWGDYRRFPTHDVGRPRLEGEADSYFWLRVMFARDVISGIVSGEPLPLGLANGRPDLTDYVNTLNWFLITLWDAIGKEWLQLFAARQRAVMRFKL